MVGVPKNIHLLTFILRFVSYSQRKSRTWRNSLRLWEESKLICQKLRTSSSRRARKTTQQNSSSEPQNTCLPLKSMTGKKLKQSWSQFHPVSTLYPFYTLFLRLISLTRPQISNFLFYIINRPQEGSHQVRRMIPLRLQEQLYAYWQPRREQALV